MYCKEERRDEREGEIAKETPRDDQRQGGVHAVQDHGLEMVSEWV